MNNNGQKQVSLAGAAGNPVGKVKPKRKCNSRGRL